MHIQSKLEEELTKYYEGKTDLNGLIETIRATLTEAKKVADQIWKAVLIHRPYLNQSCYKIQELKKLIGKPAEQIVQKAYNAYAIAADYYEEWRNKILCLYVQFGIEPKNKIAKQIIEKEIRLCYA